MAHISNLYDTFFEGGRDHRVPKPSVTHMPYLEGERNNATLPSLHTRTVYAGHMYVLPPNSTAYWRLRRHVCALSVAITRVCIVEFIYHAHQSAV